MAARENYNNNNNNNIHLVRSTKPGKIQRHEHNFRFLQDERKGRIDSVACCMISSRMSCVWKFFGGGAVVAVVVRPLMFTLNIEILVSEEN